MSEAQVRQYLDEGLVLPTDLASYHGMDDWMPLEHVLARLPTFAPAADPDPVPPPEPVAEPPPLEEGATDDETESFIMPNESAPPTESTLAPITSQKTKRTKIVVQPMLPLETKLPSPKRTGTTAVALESLRSTLSLPKVTGAPAKEKPTGRSTGRTGKVALRAAPEIAARPASAPVATPPPVAIPEAPDLFTAPLPQLSQSRCLQSNLSPFPR